MSELNNDLNDVIEEMITDAYVMTVAIDDTLTVSGEAADAKATGDALALKANLADVQNIKVNAQSADNQGQIYIDGEDIQMGTGDSTTLRAAITAAAGRTGAVIPLNTTAGAPTLAEKIEEIDEKTASDILYDGSTTVADAIGEVAARDASSIESGSGTIQDALDGIDERVQDLEDDHLTKTAQTLTTEEKAVVRTNIGLGDASTRAVANNLTTAEDGYVLDAKQGTALSGSIATHTSQITALQNRNNRVNLTNQVTYDNLDSGNNATIQTGTLACYRYGNMCHLEFRLKFGSSQSSNCMAWKADLHGIPKRAGDQVAGISGSATYSEFKYTLTSADTITIRFVHQGSNASSSSSYIQTIEYIIDDNAGGGDEEQEEEES